MSFVLRMEGVDLAKARKLFLPAQTQSQDAWPTVAIRDIKNNTPTSGIKPNVNYFSMKLHIVTTPIGVGSQPWV
jgi:hypothetical protein